MYSYSTRIRTRAKTCVSVLLSKWRRSIGGSRGICHFRRRKLSPDRFHYTGRIDSPVSGIRVELQSGHNSFTTTPDANGRFVFDGLAEGEYKLFAYPRDTERSKPLAPPVTLRIQAKSCTSTVLFVPKTN